MVLAPDVDDVQLGAGPIGQVHSRKEGQLGLLGAVGGQKDLRWEDAHLLLLLCSMADPALQGLSSTPSPPKGLTRVMLAQTAVEANSRQLLVPRELRSRHIHAGARYDNDRSRREDPRHHMSCSFPPKSYLLGIGGLFAPEENGLPSS